MSLNHFRNSNKLNKAKNSQIVAAVILGPIS